MTRASHGSSRRMLVSSTPAMPTETSSSSPPITTSASTPPTARVLPKSLRSPFRSLVQAPTTAAAAAAASEPPLEDSAALSPRQRLQPPTPLAASAPPSLSSSPTSSDQKRGRSFSFNKLASAIGGLVSGGSSKDDGKTTTSAAPATTTIAAGPADTPEPVKSPVLSRLRGDTTRSRSSSQPPPPTQALLASCSVQPSDPKPALSQRELNKLRSVLQSDSTADESAARPRVFLPLTSSSEIGVVKTLLADIETKETHLEQTATELQHAKLNATHRHRQLDRERSRWSGESQRLETELVQLRLREQQLRTACRELEQRLVSCSTCSSTPSPHVDPSHGSSDLGSEFDNTTKLLQLEHELASQAALVSQLQAALQTAEHKSCAAEEAQRDLTARLTNAKKTIVAQDSQLRTAQARAVELETINSKLSNDRSSLETRVAELASASSRLSSVEAELNQSKSDRSSLETRINELESINSKLSNDRSSLEERIAELESLRIETEMRSPRSTQLDAIPTDTQLAMTEHLRTIQSVPASKPRRASKQRARASNESAATYDEEDSRRRCLQLMLDNHESEKRLSLVLDEVKFLRKCNGRLLRRAHRLERAYHRAVRQQLAGEQSRELAVQRTDQAVGSVVGLQRFWLLFPLLPRPVLALAHPHAPGASKLESTRAPQRPWSLTFTLVFSSEWFVGFGFT